MKNLNKLKRKVNAFFRKSALLLQCGKPESHRLCHNPSTWSGRNNRAYFYSRSKVCSQVHLPDLL